MPDNIFKRGDVYRIRVPRGKNEKGKYIYRWETCRGGINEARKRRDVISAEIQKGIYVAPGKLKVGDFLDKWLRDYSKPNMSPRVHEGYESIIRLHIKPELGNIHLDTLARSRIAQYYSDKLKSKLSAQTVVHHHTVLHKAMETAIEWGLIKDNPTDRVRPPRVQRNEMSTFNPGEVAQFLTEAKKTEYYTLFKLSLFEGLRRSEILALRWSDIDLIYGVVSVNRSLHILKGHEVVIRQTKTVKSKRAVPFTPSSYLAVKEYYDWSKAVYKSAGLKITDDKLVFCHITTGQPYRPNTITGAWSRIAEKAGLKHIRLHDARHTMATLMLQAGVHPKIVQERLGHSSISITLDIYSHITPSMQQAAAKTLDDAFNQYHNLTDSLSPMD